MLCGGKLSWLCGLPGDYISSASFLERYLSKYYRYEVETLQVRRLWLEADIHPISALDCFKKIDKIKKFVQYLSVIYYGGVVLRM